SGAQAVFDQVNASGGVHGRKIQVNLLDDGYDAPRAVANARTFVNQPVFAVYGGFGTVAAEAMHSLYQGAGIPYLFPYQGDVWPTRPATRPLSPLRVPCPRGGSWGWSRWRTRSSSTRSRRRWLNWSAPWRRTALRGASRQRSASASSRSTAPRPASPWTPSGAARRRSCSCTGSRRQAGT